MRKKSHGGRDQDMWRNTCLLRRFKFADSCWDSVPKLKLKISVSGVDDCEWLKKMEREHG